MEAPLRRREGERDKRRRDSPTASPEDTEKSRGTDRYETVTKRCRTHDGEGRTRIRSRSRGTEWNPTRTLWTFMTETSRRGPVRPRIRPLDRHPHSSGSPRTGVHRAPPERTLKVVQGRRTSVVGRWHTRGGHPETVPRGPNRSSLRWTCVRHYTDTASHRPGRGRGPCPTSTPTPGPTGRRTKSTNVRGRTTDPLPRYLSDRPH